MPPFSLSPLANHREKMKPSKIKACGTYLSPLWFFFNWFITQTIYTRCTKISYKTDPATNFTT